MGTVIAHRPEQCGTQPQNERAVASGPSKGGGGPPPRLFVSGLSPRESLDPRPGPGGKPPCRCEPAAVLTEPPARGGTGLRTLWVGGAEATLRRSAPGAPPARRGVPISPEKWGERGPGLRPWTPGFDSRSFPLAGFWDRCLWYVRGAVTPGILKPIWDAFSRKNMLKSIFAKESLQIRARTWVAK